MNQQSMIAEAMRQGQAETERRMMMMRAFMGTHGENPLVEFFKQDRVIAELELDAGAIRDVFWSGYLKSPMCFMPCFWPHQIILGMPIMFCCSLNAVDTAVKAHHLVLREHSIEYRVDKYPAIGSVATGMAVVKPCCAGCCEGEAGGFHEVYPLSDVSDICVQACQAECCGSKMAPDTMVLKVSSYMGGMSAAAAIDGPKDGEAFAALVLQQQQKSKEAGGVQIPDDVQAKYNKYVSGGAGNAMGGMMGMMGGGAGAGQQMQLMRQVQQMQVQMQQQQGGALYGGPNAAACCAAGVGAPPVCVGASSAAPPVVVSGQAVAAPLEMAREAPAEDLVAQIGKLKALHDAGALDDAEFKAAKAKLLEAGGPKI